MQSFRTKLNKMGFTLVELSIVIIIIGFLIAGVSAGTSLIKQAQLNTIIIENTQFAVAIETFKATYGQLPGDFSNAYAYWGTNCTPDGNPAHCNGNGDDYLQYSAVPAFGSPETPYTHEGLHA